ARGGDRRRTAASSEALGGAQDVVRRRAVALCHVGADERLLPLRGPVVLVTGVDFPRGGQEAAGGIAGRQRAAGDAVAADAETFAAAGQRQFAGVRARVPEVLGGALGIVHLGDEVVAGRDERRVDLDAAAGHPAPLIVRMTGDRRGAVVRRIHL